MFNGSASLRNAAGQMIENVVKSTKRKQTIDEKYMAALFDEMTSLYRLDQIETADSVRKQFDSLPSPAVALLGGLALIWAGMAVYTAQDLLKKKKS